MKNLLLTTPRRSILALAAACVLSAQADAATIVWNGSTSNAWATTSNWTPSVLPNATDTVLFDATASPNLAPAISGAGVGYTIAGLDITRPTGTPTVVVSAATNFLTVTGNVTASSGNVTLIRGDGNLTAGNLTLSTSGTYLNFGSRSQAATGNGKMGTVTVSGATTIASGTTLGISNALNTFDLGDLQINGGTFYPVDGSAVNNGTPNGGTNNITVDRIEGASGTITGNKQSANATTTGHITINSATNGSFGGNITNGQPFNVIQITKTGSNTQTFSGTNTYTGATTVGGGTLLINGSHASGNYIVQSGGTLGGTGSITPGAGAGITVQSGGFLAPGASIGNFTLNGNTTTSTVLTLNSGADFNFELDGSGGTPDRLIFWNYAGSSDFVLNNNDINLTLIGTVTPGNYTVPIIRFYSDSGLTETGSGLTSGLQIGTLGTGIESASILWNSGAGAIEVQYQVVPEPRTWALFGIGLAALLARLRRRK